MNNQLKEMLIEHEGLRLKPYKCSAGKWTIAVGRNLDDLGITEEEAMHLLKNDVARVENELSQLPWFHELNETRKNVVIDMCFNLGLSRFLGFKKTIAAIEMGDYEEAAIEMLDSKWAIQVGNRAKKLAWMMVNG